MRFYIYIFCTLIALFSSQLGYTTNSLEFAQNVYERLKIAKGDVNSSLPTLMISDRIYNIAAYQQVDNQLIIEEHAIQICRSFGAQKEAALAFIIGHELTHFYQKHTGGFAFVMPNEEFSQKIIEEREADLYGAMLAYLADYEVLPILPDLLQKLYDGYHLDTDKMPNYPALQERMSIATDMQTELQHLIETYEIGLYLAALGEYTAASDCFRVVGEVIQSKAILYNQAVAMLSAAAQIQEYGKPLWAYPLQLDSKNPLRIPDEVRKEILLKKAEKLLKNVMEMDRDYIAAPFHLAILYALRDDLASAERYLAQVEQVTSPRKYDYKLLRAILLAKNGELSTAERDFQYLIQKGSPPIAALAQRNLLILKQKNIPASTNNSQRKTPAQVDGINLNYRPTITTPDKIIPLSTNVFSPRNLKIKYLPHSTLALLEMANRTIALQRISAAPKAATLQQIKNKIINANNIHQVNLANQRYLTVFYETMCIFQLDNQNRHREWAIFGIY